MVIPSAYFFKRFLFKNDLFKCFLRRLLVYSISTTLTLFFAHEALFRARERLESYLSWGDKERTSGMNDYLAAT